MSVCQRRAAVRAFRERLPHQTGFVTPVLVPAAAAATRARSLCKTERQIRRMARYITGIAFSSQHTELIIYIWLSVRRRRRRNPLSVPLSDLTHSGKDLETLAHSLTGSRRAVLTRYMRVFPFCF